MKTEKAFRSVQLYNYPSGLISAVKDKSNWSIVNTSTNPEFNQTYELQYNGKKVLGFSRLYGFGFNSNACYFPLRLSVLNLLRTVYDSHVKVIDREMIDHVVYENDYSE